MAITADEIKKQGLFLVLDGGEGTGKTTNSLFIQEYLLGKGIDFDSTREPGGTVIAEKIRKLILTQSAEDLDGLTELLLVFAARRQHLQHRIKPALHAGRWVLSDRFTDATYAYQGGGRGLPAATISMLENLVQENFRPDCVIILEADPDLTAERLASRQSLDRMELESRHFHQKVQDAYRRRVVADPARYRLVDASRPLLQVQSDIAAILDDLILSWRAS